MMNMVGRLGPRPDIVGHGVVDRCRVDKDRRHAEFVRGKQDEAGRWALEWTPHNTWASFGELKQPNKWVTLRALRVLNK